MSWMKRTQGEAGTGAGPQPYAAPQAQHFPNQQSMYPNYPGGTGSGSQQGPLPPQYWAVPPPAQPPLAPQQYNQQYAQVYQQEYPPNANQLYQQYNHNYTSPQQNYPQNYYQNQPPLQAYPQNSTNNDGWEDNWDWGWEESAKQAQKAQNAAQHLPVQQEQVFNNANVLEDSFAPTNTWNWAMDDKKGAKETAVHPSEQETNERVAPPPNPVENNTMPEPTNLHSVNKSVAIPAEEVRTLSDRDVVKERMPNLALGKRFHLDNLTPQWSIESQMSQDSSDGPQTHSESTYRSENQSRNSNSPGPNTDNSNYNYSQSALDDGYTQNSEWSKQSDELTLADSTQTTSRRESHDELSCTMQDLTLANHENPVLEIVQMSQTVEPINSQQNMASEQPVSASLPPPVSASLPPPVSASHPPLSTMSMPPPLSSATLPPPTSATPPGRPPSANSSPTPTPPSAAQHGPPAPDAPHPPPVSNSASLPPPNFPPPSNSQNPFKHAGPFAHKSKASSSSAPAQPFPPQIPGANLTSPAAVGKVSQPSRTPVGFEANLETTPDNSERPDHPQAAAFRPTPAPQQVPDNLEVAPQNDRNEYLQTAHLSSGDYGENTDFTRNMPPPGLRRMVVGQQESEYGRGAAAAGDEPPPGLARMVPGQQTEGDGGYGQPGDDYRDRLIDGRPTDGGRPYRRADGQRSPDAYAPRAAERRPVGRDRAPPGEPGADYAQYERRVVTGFERDFPAPSDVREQNVDGSDYGARAPPDYRAAPDAREGTMEGENLQDLSAVSSAELSYSRDQTLADAGASPAPERAEPRRDSDDADRDRAFQASPRRDRRNASRDRDRDRDGRHPRPDRKHERDDRRSARDDRRPDRDRRDRRDRDRRDRDESPDERRRRRAARSRRYETEDTDYYSDKERDRRRHREGSYSSKPPRPEEPERARRERHERVYRDIDPARKHGNRRRDRDRDRDDDRRHVTFSRDAKANDISWSEGSAYSPGSRSGSRSATATDEEAPRARRRTERRERRAPELYYDGYPPALYGGATYAAQRQQYEYYERLRRADPAAYMQLYARLMAGAPADPREGYSSLGYEARGEERGSVHSGRSSAAGLKGNDTYLLRRGSPRDAADVSDRDLNTEVSLPTNLETSTVRSERMTPHRFSTAHVKGSISSRHLVVVRGAWPVDGRPATVQLLSLAAALAGDAAAAELAHSPGPLVKGVTHKKSVIEYCMVRVRSAAREAPRDTVGYVLLWELLALLLRQNGVVVGSDIAELLMKNTGEYEYKSTTNKSSRDESRRASCASGSEARASPDSAREPAPGLGSAPVDEAAALDKFREHLLYGNQQEALEWAMCHGLWGHALLLGAYSARRTRGAVAARFLAATPRADPLHTLYATLARARPPAATCVAEEGWADWRPHAAIILANAGVRPDHDATTLTTLGDSLSSRGLIYSAQFCYVSGGEPFARHPLAPLAPSPSAPSIPRLALLLADPRAATLAQLATSRAVLATEIYEYALSLNRDYVIPELQVYKFVLACRLVDCGQYERALAYVEQAARAVALAPGDYSRALLHNLAELGDRLKYHDPALHEDPPLLEEGEGEGSPRHQQWLSDVAALAQHMEAEASQHATPQHVAGDYYAQEQLQQQQLQQQQLQQQQLQQQQYSWDQANQYQQQMQQQPQQLTPPAPQYAEPEEGAVPSPPQYYQAPPADAAPSPPAPAAAPEPEAAASPPYAYEDWNRTEEHHSQAYADSGYWRPDPPAYNESATDGADSNPRPMITMPGASATHSYADYDDDRPPSAEQRGDRETETPKSSRKPEGRKEEAKGEGRGKGGGWLGGILTKLSLRPPNQMILPDDKNPTIVWDAESKRWKNLDGEETESARAPPPPPRLADLAGLADLAPRLQQNTSTPIAAAPAQAQAPGATSAAPVSNIFKMQKGRHIKKSYVDVFNPRGAATRALPPAADVLGPAPALAPDPHYFVPAPAPAPAQTIHVSIPPSPTSTPRPRPVRLPSTTSLAKSGEYEGSQAPDYHIRSGI